MEEKKIIGQECEFYDEGHCLCYSDESHYPHCLEYPNCYYKQLQFKDKMIDLILWNIVNSQSMTNTITYASLFYKFEQQALSELEK